MVSLDIYKFLEISEAPGDFLRSWELLVWIHFFSYEISLFLTDSPAFFMAEYDKLSQVELCGNNP